MQKYTFNVTQEHIDRGVQDECDRCPVALAIAEQTPFPFGFVEAYGDYIMWSCVIDQYARAPFEVNRFITRFDDGLPVAPFSFELEIGERLEVFNEDD